MLLLNSGSGWRAIEILACLSHHLTVQAHDKRANTSLRLLVVLDGLSSTPVRAKRRASRLDTLLTHLASPRGEKGRLVGTFEPNCLLEASHSVLPGEARSH